MNNENDFIDGIWNKYDAYSKNEIKDRFFKKHLYKHTEYYKSIGTLLSLILIILGSIGITYSRNSLYKEIPQSNSQANTAREINYNDFYGDLKVEDGKLYKKIFTYQDYLSSKEKFGNIVEMSEDEFENNFVLLIVLESYEYSKTYISNVGSDKDTIHVELKKYNENEEFDINNNVLSTKIAKTLDRENVKIELIYTDEPYSDKYGDLKKITRDYTKEQAILDNCFVVENYKIISNDVKQLENFVEKTQKNENSFIRVVEFVNINNSDVQTIIAKDIEYRNGKYLIESIYIGEDTDEIKVYHYTGTKLEIKHKKMSKDGPIVGTIYRILLDDTLIQGQVFSICYLDI